MQSLTLFYLFPAIAFLIVSGIWLANRSPGILGWLPIAACYLCSGLVLFLGGCHQMAHVQLKGVEIDLGTPESPREIMIGGPPEDAIEQPAPAFEVSGYPYDALRLKLHGDGLVISPGSGFDRSIVVQSGEEIVPLLNSIPALYHLQDQDIIEIGSDVSTQKWTLGRAADHLTPTTGNEPRWVGRDGTGVAFSGNLPPSVVGLQVKSGNLIVTRGPGFSGQIKVIIDGQPLEGEQESWSLPYDSGKTTLEISTPDLLAGNMTVNLGVESASLSWKSASAENPPSLLQSAILRTGDTITMGGGPDDEIRVFGLLPGFFELTLNPDKNIVVSLSKAGIEAMEEGKGLYADHRISRSFAEYKNGKIINKEDGWTLGTPESPTGGKLIFRIQSNASGREEERSAPAEVSGDLPTEPELSSDSIVAEIRWLSNPQTEWVLPNRQVTLPMFPDHTISLFTRRNFRQAAFPLKRASGYPSSVTSCLFSGLQNEDFNSLSLLQTDPGVRVFRDGKPLRAANGERPLGLLEPNAEISFLQLLTTTNDVRTGGSGSRLSDILRLATRDKFAKFELTTRPNGNSSRRILAVDFINPEIQAIPMGDIKHGKKIAESDDRSISFGVNEVSGFSTESYQVRFKALTSWFRKANAKVVLQSDITVQDDYRTQEIDYSTPFTIGDRDRLRLEISKRTIPFKTIFWLLTGGLILVSVFFVHRNDIGWYFLLFGIAFLTCSRVLFAQAAMVNPPYSFEAASTATFAVIIIPLMVAVMAIALPLIMPGRLEAQLRQWQNGAPFTKLAIAAGIVFAIRVAFLFLGFKESVNLGVGRFALSIISVPAHIIIFSLGCARLFAERKSSGSYEFSLIGKFFTFVCALFFFQFATAFLVSDVGLFLYLLPQVLIVALIGLSICIEATSKLRRFDVDKTEVVSQALTAVLLVLPLAFTIWTFTSPRILYSMPVLSGILATDQEIATGSTELRILQFINEEYLIKLGTDTAERIAQDHAIMENYARRGLWGEGYLQVDVIHAKRNTSLNDNVSAIFIFAQFGILGALAVALAYLSVVFSTSQAADGINGPVGWAAVTASLTFCLASVYMMAANYGFLPFTGRNMYLLGLNSKSDLIESLGVLFFCILALVYAAHRKKISAVSE